MEREIDRGLSRKEVLDTMFSLITKNKNVSSYAMKGGYILSNFVCKQEGLRSTSDLDMSVETEFDFDSVINAVKPYLDELKGKGLIYDYRVKRPLVTENKNMSGGIKVYKKFSANERKRIFVGIDISLHPLNYGVVTTKGFKVFALERSIVDKISATYGTNEMVVRRIRDLYDLYILNSLDITLSRQLLNFCLKKRKVDIMKESTVEKLLKTQKGYFLLESAVNTFLSDNIRVDNDLVVARGITFNCVIKAYLYILDLLRS